ncbi:hypothetical protein GCM10010245_20920 [Streptomyces spectabilis]|nr:hypothetical protein GCM10010245_20920 [Streptomyces spectabilis]
MAKPGASSATGAPGTLVCASAVAGVPDGPPVTTAQVMAAAVAPLSATLPSLCHFGLETVVLRIFIAVLTVGRGT